MAPTKYKTNAELQKELKEMEKQLAEFKNEKLLKNIPGNKGKQIDLN